MFVDFTIWKPWGEPYKTEAGAVQMAGALKLFKKGTRVIKSGKRYHVLYWDGEYTGPDCLCGDEKCEGGGNEPE